MNFKDMWKILLKEVLDPGARNVMSDLIVNAKDLLLFGNGDGPSSAPKDASGNVEYNKVPQNTRQNLTLSERELSDFNFSNLRWPSKDKAKEVLDSLRWRINKYGDVTVGYFLDLIDYKKIKDDYVFKSVGWEKIPDSVQPYNTARGWAINLPPVIKLNS